jgi:membrane protein
VPGLKKRLHDFIIRELWEKDIPALRKDQALVIKFLRLVYITIQEFTEPQLNLRASSLVYTTLLSLVPFLAVSFSVLKAFGIHSLIEPVLSRFLTPFGSAGREIAHMIIGFVGNIDAGVLGSLGLITLLYTVISLIQKVEAAFNYTWKVRKGRSFTRRFSDYISVILIGPVLIFSALGITASITNMTVVQKILSLEPFGLAIYLAGKLIPYFLIFLAFTFFYIFIPNTRVRLGSALTGGLLASVLWAVTGRVFASFAVSSTRYAAIYSGFAILIVFMIWIYLNWLILLVGSKISFYYQYPRFFSAGKDTFPLSTRLKEGFALLILSLVGRHYYYNQPPWDFASLQAHLGLPVEPLQGILTLLEHGGYLIETGTESPAYVPARDIETMPLKEILHSIRTDEEKFPRFPEKGFRFPPEVEGIMKNIEDALDSRLGDETLKDLVLSSFRKEHG